MADCQAQETAGEQAAEEQPEPGLPEVTCSGEVRLPPLGASS